MKKSKKPIVAICYDFDGTLCPGNMQEYGFFLGLEPAKRKTFWRKSNGMAAKLSADPNLTYMLSMIDSSNGVKTTQTAFRDYGRTIALYEGVKEWFGRIRKYGKERGLVVQHYIISSGLKEMVEGSIIGKEFERIYACSFIYDANGAAMWPAQVVNCTSKTQYLFRINKGITDDADLTKLNEFVKQEDRAVPFNRMIYIGDGSTDIPCMRLVKEQGGISIGVYKPKTSQRKVAEKLYKDGRINFVTPADYSEGASLDDLVKRIIDKICAQVELEKLGKKLNPKDEEQKNCDKTNTSFEDKKIIQSVDAPLKEPLEQNNNTNL